MKQPHHPPLDEVTLERALGALSDPLRLGIVAALADGGEKGWSQFQVGVGKSTLSHHMKTLREAGVTWTRMEGTRCYVSLRKDFSEKFPGLIPTLLSLRSEEGPQ